ncbi:AfsR/SARP family transcriptional regulator [Dactylosporangium sp. NPDC050688]|uniref:AfsR/SARP family transcriptional regulator n=1 Tax=Dactylosporangium sp. NPDC050688 TaxID=3157217 RepID=UPI0033CB1118
MLAVLLINANQVVSLDHLVDELWGERPPPTACNLVRQYISQLRKLLATGPPGGTHLRTHAAGYMLSLGGHSLDATEFRHLAQDARAELAANRPAQARETLARALGLWRGQAFADVAVGPSAAAERVSLDEVYSSVRELSAEADLAAGHVSEAICELTGLTARFPLHERPYLLLMRALSQAGRNADALAVYRSARTTLVNEVGLEPGRELRDAERQILALAG